MRFLKLQDTIKEVKKIIYRHVKINFKDYLILSIIFIIGVIIGTMLINNSDQSSKNEINGYINSLVTVLKNESFEIDKLQLTKQTICNNLKLALIIWACGTTIIGIPLIYIIMLYKGVSIGYTISAMMITLGNFKGFIFSILALLLQNIIVIPIILMLNVSSIKLYRVLIKKDKTASIKQELIRHTIFCIILIIPIILASIISSIVSSSLIIYFIKQSNFFT